MRQLKIRVHSVIDIITNSSTEIFVSANYSSIEAIKRLINHFLKMTNSDKTCDDLFEITIDSEGFTDYLNDKCNIDPSIDVCLNHDYDAKTLYENYIEYEANNGWGVRSSIWVKAKVEDKDAKEIASILSNLEDLFDSEIVYC